MERDGFAGSGPLPLERNLDGCTPVAASRGMQRRRSASVIAISTCLTACLGTAACGSDSGAVDSAAGTDDPTESSAHGTDAHDTSSDDSAADTQGSTHDSVDSSGGSDDDHGDDESDDDGDDDGRPPPDELPYDPDQLAVVCARGNADPIAIRLCTDPAPPITSISDLYAALDMVLEPASVAFLANSTSLAARSVSVINPRVFLRVQPGNGSGVDLGATAFSRGEHVVEMFGYDEAADSLNFYLLTFYPPCLEAPEGCSLAERFTPAIESGWTKWSLYQDVDLVNTTLDCLTCHQPAGPDTEKLLLMQQGTDPWLQWFPGISLGTGEETLSSTLLTSRFLEMHGDEEAYGGLPMSLFDFGTPLPSGIVMDQMLEIYWSIKGGPPPGLTPLGQEHEFDSIAIEADIAAGSTATWDGYFADFLAGERLPIPFFDHDITDPDARAAVVGSYQGVMAGTEPAEELLDPRDVIADDTAVALGFRPRPEADAAEILHSVCQRCHNDRLDQSLSRADFNATRPDELTAEQKLTAIERINRPADAPGHMPPARFATLPDAAKATLLDFLAE